MSASPTSRAVAAAQQPAEDRTAQSQAGARSTAGIRAQDNAAGDAAAGGAAAGGAAAGGTADGRAAAGRAAERGTKEAETLGQTVV